jgi:uncharacterized membrane protein
VVEPSLTQSLLQVLAAIVAAVDVALRQGGLPMLLVLLVVWGWLRRRHR